jgi:hypothetical protein
MATSQSRERIIRAAWEERGRAEWDPETHGRGLLSLNIPATAAMRPIRFGEPRPPYDNLEFHLVHATMGGQPVNSIVCEDVVVETVEGPIPPPTGWMNSSDDAANQVVQTAAENRRRNMASISSGPTFVPAPLQEQPPQPVGMLHPGVQDHAAQTFTFADNEAVTSWLEGQSEDVAVVFSARAALRVLPTIPFSPWPGTGTRITRETTLGVFRAVATAWAVAAYPGYRRELNDAARAALSGLGDIKALAPLDAAAYASATATGDAGATSHAATVIAHALDAAGLRGRQAFQSLLEALATDAGLLNDRFSAVALAHSKLWPGQIPEWLRISWGELRHALVDADENWGVWTNWYEQRLGGQATSQEIENRARYDRQRHLGTRAKSGERPHKRVD